MTPSVSVVVCVYTLDRWDDIEAGLRALNVQTQAPSEIIFVVDHNDELFARAARELPTSSRVRVLASTRPRGLSGARNTGVGNATGDIVAFLDDDACPDPTWLQVLTEPFGDPAVQVTGGRAVAAWPGARPAWFPDEFDWVVGSAYRGLPSERADVRNVIGAAMAMRRSVFEVAGHFAEDVGRTSTLPLGCEETELCIRIRSTAPDARVVYVPDAVVHHRVSPDRLRLAYFARRCLAEGRSKAQISAMIGTQAATASERSYVATTLPYGVVRGLAAALRGEPAGLQRAAAIVVGLTLTVLGYLDQALRRRLAT